MEIITNLSDVKLSKPFGLTIGNFDGVHLGHQKLLSYVKEKCRKDNLAFVVMTFAPHPQEIINPGNYFLLNSKDEKRELLEKCDVDYLCEVKFDRNFSTQSPDEFLGNHLLCNDSLKKLFLGHDFAFGANKSGTKDLAAKYCDDKSVTLENLPKFEFGDERVSSSLVRGLIAEGKLEEANDFLGRDFHVSGRVVKGDGRGRQIGFPTANIGYENNRVLPAKGVYITRTQVDSMSYFSVTNIGQKPTFVDDGGLTLESHILDFERDIYGEELRVSFIKKLRDEVKFDSVNSLVKQINKDVIMARDFFEKA